MRHTRTALVHPVAGEVHTHSQVVRLLTERADYAAAVRTFTTVDVRLFVIRNTLNKVERTAELLQRDIQAYARACAHAAALGYRAQP